MNELWVVNASPVIVLAKVGRLGLLTSLSREICLPQAVVDEIAAGPIGDPARKAIESGWGSRTAPQVIHADLLEWGLGSGETSVLALALERDPAIGVLDDAAARNCAKVVGVPVIGSVGIVIRAKKQGLIPSAAEALKAIRRVGLYFGQQSHCRSTSFRG